MLDKKEQFGEEQFIEAIRRLEGFEKLGGNPKLAKYFKEHKLYYSYLTFGQTMGCIDTITYDEAYAKRIEKFQKENPDKLVYHVIESKTAYGTMLSILYVGEDKEEWCTERLTDTPMGYCMFSYVVNLDNEKRSEYGDIFVTVDNGAIIRIA